MCGDRLDACCASGVEQFGASHQGATARDEIVDQHHGPPLHPLDTGYLQLDMAIA